MRGEDTGDADSLADRGGGAATELEPWRIGPCFPRALAQAGVCGLCTVEPTTVPDGSCAQTGSERIDRTLADLGDLTLGANEELAARAITVYDRNPSCAVANRGVKMQMSS